MFGNNDNQQVTMGDPTVQEPSMLDNVSTQDFTTNDSPTPQPAQDSTQDQTATTPTIVNHPITSDNPFIQSASPVPDQPSVVSEDATNPNDNSTQPASDALAFNSTAETPVVDDSPFVAITTGHPSGPVMPPEDNQKTETTIETPTPESIEIVSDTSSVENTVVMNDTPAEESTTPTFEVPQTSKTIETSTADSPSSSSVPPVDTNKLADMKQQVIGHLEPLVEHLDQSPEEEFETTLMLIRANDNHTLLEKALDAAKRIENDKIRAQAFSEIINEINYFSQN